MAERKISSASMAETEVEAAVDEGAEEAAAAATLGRVDEVGNSSTKSLMPARIKRTRRYEAARMTLRSCS